MSRHISDKTQAIAVICCYATVFKSYENGVCVKNEFGTYTTKIIINSFVNYKKTKKEKCNYKMSDYFGADVLNKLK